jgi:hypothetical protein
VLVWKIEDMAELAKFLDNQQAKAKTANCPSERAPPVGGNETIDREKIIAMGESVVKWNLDKDGGSPHQA